MKTNLKKIKTKKRKITFGMLLIFFLLFSTYSVLAFQKESVTRTTKNVGSYMQKGVFQHKAFFSNVSLYGNVKSMEYYPKDITESIAGVYVYTLTPGEEITGKYKLTIVTTYYTSKGKEKIIFWEEKLVERSGDLENGMIVEAISFDLNEINKRTTEVTEGLGIKRLSRDIKIIVQVSAKGKVNGKEVNEKFEQTINMVIDSGNGLIYFTNEEVKTKKNLVDREVKTNFLSVLGKPTSVSTAKKAFPILALLSALPIFGMVYTAKANGAKDGLEDLKRYIIKGIPNKVDKKITLATEEDLRKTFDLIDKPIMHYQEGDNDVYAIVDDGIVYEYRRDLEES
ncbi:Hypothetical protein TES1_1939 [Thermococcus paralvinellae]|uniref:DUF5305 domain-containing protein n=2 Tax=Thermococcus paralvinellae TaxID=582419 RepID=W0I5G7_9EURY|nr:Hypothetical protein TES1_1939 [Thermococcus paralvinellae]